MAAVLSMVTRFCSDLPSGAVAMIGAMGAIAAALIATQPWNNDDGGSVPVTTVPSVTFPDFDEFISNASVFLSRDSGPVTRPSM